MKKIIYDNLEKMIEENVQEKMYIHIASTMARPNALINTMIRMFEEKNPQFTFSVTAVHGNLHAIAISGIAKKVITGFLGDNYPKPRANNLYANVLKNHIPFEIEMVSLLTFILRLMGGALNLPYMVTNSLGESNLENSSYTNTILVGEKKEEKIRLIKSLFPDITVVHGVCADNNGNIILSSPSGEGQWGCLAARKGVLATVEKIVDAKTFEMHSDKVIIPSSRVLGICEVPYGAYPQAVRTFGIEGIQNYYDDYDYFVEARELVSDSLTAQKWYMDNIKKCCSHDYWKHIAKRNWKLIHEGKEQYKDINIDSELTLNEILIILAARTIIRTVKKGNYKTILAGIGMSHIATWVAQRILNKEGIEIQVMAELGFYGMTAVDGDVFLFSQKIADTTKQRCDILQILGTQVGFERTCLGVVGAAEVDCYGNINSSQLSDGTYMTGSGGANDIASVTDCIVVCVPGKKKLVNKVNFITSPGANISSIVTTFGEFEKEDGKFKLNSWYDAKKKYITPQNALLEYSQWGQNQIKEILKYEPEISEEERKVVWEIDRKGVYRK